MHPCLKLKEQALALLQLLHEAGVFLMHPAALLMHPQAVFAVALLSGVKLRHLHLCLALVVRNHVLEESRMEAIGSASFLVILRPPEDDALGVPAGIRASDGRRSSEVLLNRGAGVVALVSKAARSGRSSSRFCIPSSSGVSELGLKSGSLRLFSSKVFVNSVFSSDRSTTLVLVSVLCLFARELEYRLLGRVFGLQRAGVFSGFFSFALTLYLVERKSSASRVSAFLAMSSQCPASASPPSAQTFLQVICMHRHRRTNQFRRVVCIRSS